MAPWPSAPLGHEPNCILTHTTRRARGPQYAFIGLTRFVVIVDNDDNRGACSVRGCAPAQGAFRPELDRHKGEGGCAGRRVGPRCLVQEREPPVQAGDGGLPHIPLQRPPAPHIHGDNHHGASERNNGRSGKAPLALPRGAPNVNPTRAGACGALVQTRRVAGIGHIAGQTGSQQGLSPPLGPDPWRLGSIASSFRGRRR